MGKKTRIFKLAKELNLASDDLIAFLKDAGFEVRNVNSPVDEGMLSAVMEKFSAEKVVAEKKTAAKRKRMIQRGELDIEDSSERGTEVKEAGVAKRPAILDVLESIQQNEKTVADAKLKEKTEAPAKTKKPKKAKKIAEEIVKVKPAVEEVTPVEESAVESVKEDDIPFAKIEESIAIEPEVVEAEIKEESKLIEEVVETVPELPVEPVVEDPQMLETKVGDKIRSIDLSVFNKKAPEKSKEKSKEKEKVKEKQADKKGKPHRKLSKKGKGVVEKSREKKEPDAPVTPAGDEAVGKKGKKKKRSRKKKVDQKEVEAAIKQTMAKMEESSKSKKHKKKSKEEVGEEDEKLVIKLSEFTSVAELASMMDISNSELITKCLELGMMVTINQRLDMDTIHLLADEFEFEVEEIDAFGEIENEIEEEEELEENLESRPPIVTIMGHVDHGKTSLLDYLREENVVAGEKGGITQHIGAYEVDVNGKQIAFLDTPGHEAFTAMRARGAQVTDIVVLIVAADDAVMPQTLEALNHAQAASVPIIIAINKIDKPTSNPEKIKQQLAEHNVLVEDWGGKFPSIEISAKKGIGIDLLLETILIQAEILELKANPNRMAKGVVIEARQEKGKGTVCTVLIQTGTLKHGDNFVCGQFHGRVRAKYNERNKKVDDCGPSTPVQVLGFSGTPQAGDLFMVMDSDKAAKDLSSKRTQLKREQDFRRTSAKSLFDISEQIRRGEVKELPIILKADVDGSLEALDDSFNKLNVEEVEVKIIHKSIGAITEADVLLAAASSAIIIGFHIRPNFAARQLAEKDNVDIRLYEVIYDAIADVKSALEGMLSPTISEEIIATVEIRDVFKIPKVGTIAGCYVLSGPVVRNAKVRLIRDGIVVYDGKLISLKRFKEDAKEVATGFECGVGLENYNDLKVADILETYKVVEEKRVLE